MSIAKLSSAMSRQFLKLATTKLAATSSYSMGLPSIASFGSRPLARSYHVLSSRTIAIHDQSKRCNCGSCRAMSVTAALNTEGDKELSQFLKEEIAAEKLINKTPSHGPGVPGFDVSANGSNITLTKRFGDENIKIRINVNGVIDDIDEPEEDFQQNANQPDAPPPIDLKARPDFTVEIKKPSGRSLVFNCRIFGSESLDPEVDDQAKGDKFEIEHFSVLNKEDVDETGEWDENVYLGEGSIIDGQMYDLLMNYLDERGVGVEFCDHLVDFATHYEHTQYLGLLENLKSFVEGK